MLATELTISGLHQSHHNKRALWLWSWSFKRTASQLGMQVTHVSIHLFGGCGGGL